jgi:glycosyltransferase 2 family protein
VGGVALNIRYLNKAKVPPAEAASSVGVSQVFAFALHMLLLVIFIALTGGSASTPFHPPDWAYIALAVLGAAVLGVLALPAGRRLIRSRVAPALGQVIPRLIDITQRPAKLGEGIGGALLLTFSYILCLDASVRALGGHAPFFALAVVYLAGSAVGSVVPTPGGLGAVELALSGGLTTIAHVHTAIALSAVLLFRLLSFWLPIPFGWVAMNYLQRKDAL